MAFDAHANLAISSVSTAPSPPTSGTSLVVSAGEGARFSAPPFNCTVWPSAATPTPVNAEIVRVTARTTDTLTIVRAQEGSTARAIGAGDLIAASITAKTLTDLETQAAIKADANVFTQDQEIAKAGPRLGWRDTSEALNAKLFRIANLSQTLSVYALDDAATAVLTTPLILTRTADAKVGRDLYEKGRPTPLGHWITNPFNAANFSAPSGGPWVVSAGQVVTNRYTLIGKTLCWSLGISGASLSSPAGNLRAALPSGLTIANSMLGGAGMGNFGAWAPLMVQQSAGQTGVDIFKSDAGVIAAGTNYVHFTITLEIV